MMNRTTSLQAATLWLVVFCACIITANAYISYPDYVPRQRQLAWLKDLTNDFTHSPTLSPSQKSTSHDLLHAWSHTPVEQPLDKALALESLIQRIIQEQQQQQQQQQSAASPEDLTLTTDDYNCLLEGWARSGAGAFAAERCEDILQGMQEHSADGVAPNVQSYKLCLLAWKFAANQDSLPHAGQRAQRLLEDMIRQYDDDDSNSLLPDADCFDSVLQTWSKSSHPQAPQHAERCLVMMERLYEHTQWSAVKPRTTSFNAVLATWARAHHQQPEAALRASHILQFMRLLYHQHQDATVAPDKASYGTVMNAIANAYKHKNAKNNKSKNNANDIYNEQAARQAAQQATELLEQALEQCQQGLAAKNDKKAETPLVVPDAILFNTAMGCWAKTNQVGAYKKARRMLEQQTELCQQLQQEQDDLAIPQAILAKALPDVYGYTSVIASCASESSHQQEHRAKAFQTAWQTFAEMQEAHVAPNHVTYGNLLKACIRLISDKTERQSKAREILDLAAEDGCVGDMVLSRAKECLGKAYVREWMGDGSNLPREWTRRVPGAPRQERAQRLARPLPSRRNGQNNNNNNSKRRNKKHAPTSTSNSHQHHSKNKSNGHHRRSNKRAEV